MFKRFNAYLDLLSYIEWYGYDESVITGIKQVAPKQDVFTHIVWMDDEDELKSYGWEEYKESINKEVGLEELKQPLTLEGLTLFRFHRGSLADAMRTVVEVKTREELEKLILEKDGEWLPKALQMRIEKYGEGIDTRINWDTHIVMWGHTVIGFLSGPLDN